MKLLMTVRVRELVWIALRVALALALFSLGYWIVQALNITDD